MSNHHPNDSTSSWHSNSSRFREHLSIQVPSHDIPVQKSQFSPVTPPTTSHGARADAESSTTHARSRSYKSDVEAGLRTAPVATSRFKKWLGLDRPEVIMIQNKHCTCKEKKKKSKSKWLIILLIIILLYLLADSVFLNIKYFGLPSGQVQGTPASPSPSSPSGSTPPSLSVEAQQCISQFKLNAPTNPSSYPCSSCLSVLQSIPSNVQFTNSQDKQQVANAVQFCGLNALFVESNTDGQTGLSNGGWLKDLKFCQWNGVSCDDMGRVSSLQFTFPNVPVVFPDGIGALTGLQSLQVIGNNALPAGSLPASMMNLSSLSNLHIESTAITSFPDDIFSSLSKILTLALVKNGKMGPNLPSSLNTTSIQNLVINGQTLNNPLAFLASSSSLQASLKLIDLTQTMITGVIPASITSLSGLLELHLDSNNLQPPLPSAFPSTLTALTLNNNTALMGTVPSEICGSSSLQSCDFRNTGLSAGPNGCGICQFA